VTSTNDGRALVSYPVASGARALAYDGANMWVVGGSTLTRIPVSNVRSGSTTVYPTSLGSSLSAVAFDGINIWVSNSSQNLVYVINPQTAAVLGTISTFGQGPMGMAFDGKLMWVVDQGSSQFELIQWLGGGGISHTAPIALPGNPGGSLAFDGTNMWIPYNLGACCGGGVAISPAANASAFTPVTIPTGFGLGTGAAFDGNNIWLDGMGGAFKLSASGTVLSTVNVDPGAAGMAFDGTHVWVACQGGSPYGSLDKL
jgi:YVTN family beta-propeller protein